MLKIIIKIIVIGLTVTVVRGGIASNQTSYTPSYESTEADYSQIVADAAGVIVPELNGALKAEKIAEMKNTYESDERDKDDLVYGWETKEIFIRYLMRDGVDEATVSFFPYGMSYEEPSYKW